VKTNIPSHDLSLDLVELGNWLHQEFRFRPTNQLRSAVAVTVELIGNRYRQYGLTNEYLTGICETLSSLVLIDRKRITFCGISFLGNSRVSRYWREPKETADLIARSLILSVLRHLSGSAVEFTSGLRGILIAEIGLGLDGLLRQLDLRGNVDEFERFALSWSQDINDHKKFLREE